MNTTVQPEAVLYRVANDWRGEHLFEWDTSSETFYGINGHQGVTWTAGTSGTVSATMRYDPWGALGASSGSYLPPFRFQGSWFDPTAALQWVVTRWYAPTLGRFVSQDSLLGQMEVPAARHLYAYVQGDPVTGSDPFGMSSIDGPPGQRGPFWHRLTALDSVYNLAQRFLGDRRKWPVVFNMNRRIFKWPTEIHVGACAYVAAPRSLHTGDDCKGSASDITGAGDYDHWRSRAARTLGIDWWMLTQPDIISLTERETGFHTFGNVATYAHNLSIAARDAKALKDLDGSQYIGTYPSGGSPRYVVYKGNRRFVPFGSAEATTIGPVIFVGDQQDVKNESLMGHEYIHVMQYATSAWQEANYLGEWFRVGGGPENKYEAIGYLWAAWIDSYYHYGGPTGHLPQDIWRAPTLQRISSEGILWAECGPGCSAPGHVQYDATGLPGSHCQWLHRHPRFGSGLRDSSHESVKLVICDRRNRQHLDTFLCIASRFNGGCGHRQ